MIPSKFLWYNIVLDHYIVVVQYLNLSCNLHYYTQGMFKFY